MTVPELKRHLVTAALAVAGRKADLVKRLLDAGHVGEGNIPEHLSKKKRGVGVSKNTSVQNKDI